MFAFSRSIRRRRKKTARTPWSARPSRSSSSPSRPRRWRGRARAARWRWRCAASPTSTWSRTDRRSGSQARRTASTSFATASPARRRHRSDRRGRTIWMQGKSAGDADLAGPRPVVFGCRGADAQSGPDAGAGERPSRRGADRRPTRQTNARFLALGIGKSVVIDLPRDIKDVLVADPKIANAVVRSSRRAYIIGAAVGQTNIVFFDAEGQQIAGLRHRGQARPQRRARRAEADAAECRHPDRGRRRRRHAVRLGGESDRGAAGRRSRRAAGGRRRQGRQLRSRSAAATR